MRRNLLKLFYVLAGIVVVGSSLVAWLPQQAKAAGVSGKWSNGNSSIIVNGTTYDKCSNNCPDFNSSSQNPEASFPIEILSANVVSSDFYLPSNWPSLTSGGVPDYSCTSGGINQLVGKSEILGNTSSGFNFYTYIKPKTVSIGSQSRVECINQQTLNISAPPLPSLTGTFVNASEIQITGGANNQYNGIYFDQQLDGKGNYFLDGQDKPDSSGNCANEITVNVDGNGIPTKTNGTYVVWLQSIQAVPPSAKSFISSCTDSHLSVTHIANVNVDTANVAADQLKWVATNAIEFSDGSETFSQQSPSSTYQDTNYKGLGVKVCIINVTPNDDTKNSTGTLENNCSGNGSTKVDIAAINNKDPSVAAYQNSQGASGPSATGCEAGFSLSWILCSVISGLANFINGIYQNIINPLLDQPQSSMLLDTSKPYFKVWSNFRIYGDIFLVIALLVIVFGESIGGGLIDAYAAKKVLPRLLVSAILINLSIYLVAIAVDLTSVLGHGIYSLFVLPFNGSTPDISGFKLHLNLGGDLLTFLGAGTATIWVATAGGGFLHFLFITLLGGGGLIFIGILTTLVLRVAIILALIFVSPVAFGLYCLPNTEQYFRKWWDLLFKALLVYPIVGALFALANITSLTLSNLKLGGIAQSFAQVLALFGLFAPLILIPFAFRFAGGAIGAIHQGLNRAVVAPGVKGIGGVRARRRQELHEKRMKAQGRMGTGRIGSLYRGVATLGTNKGWTPTARGRRRFTDYNQLVKDQAAAEMLEKGGARAFNNDDASAAAVGATSANDFVTRYVGRGHSEEEAHHALSRAELATGATMGSDAMAVAALRFRVGMTSTAYDAGPAGLQQMRTEVQDMERRGLITIHDAAGWMKSNQGRADYSTNGYPATVDFLQGFHVNADGTHTAYTAEDQLEGAFAGADPRAILASHQRGVEGFAQQAALNFQRALATGDQRQIDRAAADVANIHNALSSTSPIKANEFATAVMEPELPGITLQRQARDPATGAPLTTVRLDPATRTPVMRDGRQVMDPVFEDYHPSLRQYLDELRSNERDHPSFHDRSREYASASTAAAAAAAAGAAAPPTPPPGGTTTPGTP